MRREMREGRAAGEEEEEKQVLGQHDLAVVSWALPCTRHCWPSCILSGWTGERVWYLYLILMLGSCTRQWACIIAPHFDSCIQLQNALFLHCTALFLAQEIRMAISRKRKELSEIRWCQNNRNFDVRFRLKIWIFGFCISIIQNFCIHSSADLVSGTLRSLQNTQSNIFPKREWH